MTTELSYYILIGSVFTTIYNKLKIASNNDQNSRQPSIVSEELKGQIDEHNNLNWYLSLDELN